jgi:hypothetical protein
LYWLDDGDDDDILLLPVQQNPHICIWEAGCRRYGPDTKEIVHYCSAECHQDVVVEYAASPWSTPSAGWSTPSAG